MCVSKNIAEMELIPIHSLKYGAFSKPIGIIFVILKKTYVLIFNEPDRFFISHYK